MKKKWKKENNGMMLLNFFLFIFLNLCECVQTFLSMFVPNTTCSKEQYES